MVSTADKLGPGIGPGKIVSLKVRLFDAQGDLLEESDTPLVYLHGAADIFPKIEQALEGRTVGEQVSVRLEPEDAFGDDDANLVHLMSKSALGGDVTLGMRFEGLPGQPDDHRIYTVVDMAGDTVVLDGNHPLAGRALRFDITVLAVEAATDAEREGAEQTTLPAFLRVGAAGQGVDVVDDSDGDDQAPPSATRH